MNVNPGELNKKIKIVLREGTKDKDGFKTLEDKVIREPYAKVTRTSGTEQMKAGTEMSIIKCRFLVRYSKKEITNDMFVLYKGIYYQIEYVNNYGDSNEYIEIVTEAGER